MPVSSDTTNRMRKITNNIFAILAEATATPPKPKKPAAIAMIRKTAAQYSIMIPFRSTEHAPVRSDAA